MVIDDAHRALELPAQAVALSTSAAARLPLALPDPTLPPDDGWTDYSMPLDADLVMERFSSATLSAVADEIALQGQLLARAFLVEVADRTTPDLVRRIGLDQAAGIAGLTAKRLAAALGMGADLVGLAEVLAVHPLLLPRSYVAVDIDRRPSAIDLTIGPCPALEESDGLTWPAIVVADGGDLVLDAVAVCIIPTATVTRTGDASWTIRADGPARDQPDTVTLTEFSTGATFAFDRRS